MEKVAPRTINIGSRNGLVPSGNKPWPEAMLTKICAAIIRHKAPMLSRKSLTNCDNESVWYEHNKQNITRTVRIFRALK